jgi:hypothetical protein
VKRKDVRFNQLPHAFELSLHAGTTIQPEERLPDADSPNSRIPTFGVGAGTQIRRNEVKIERKPNNPLAFAKPEPRLDVRVDVKPEIKPDPIMQSFGKREANADVVSIGSDDEFVPKRSANHPNRARLEKLTERERRKKQRVFDEDSMYDEDGVLKPAFRDSLHDFVVDDEQTQHAQEVEIVLRLPLIRSRIDQVPRSLEQCFGSAMAVTTFLDVEGIERKLDGKPAAEMFMAAAATGRLVITGVKVQQLERK